LWDSYDELRSALTQSIQPLYEYVQTFDQFKPEFELSADKYVKAMDERDEPVSAEELKADIFRLREEDKELRERLPESVVVSIFRVNIKDIRNNYVGKYQ
jgi:hypothetical protein